MPSRFRPMQQPSVKKKMTGLPVNQIQEMNCQERVKLGHWGLKILLIGDGVESICMIFQVV